ncbi:hypothetical protein FXB41_29475 [Bradyrhizobium canariense]|jgi:hypothetical protein|uniref:hypothetical protein n=1 Tax=Bradyrhizobium TaxID=374 RepID=UPI001CA4E0B1|nr:hypothetical protein [Bradyrhizobium canariense]MBW5438744.1 hypothetical protein [Bradyrhizobium canariense]
MGHASLRRHSATHFSRRPVKITFGELREMGISGVMVWCHCGHHVAVSADRWPDELRLSDLERRFICQVCGSRGADVRPDFAPPKMGTNV